jgi:hypothetical protein
MLTWALGPNSLNHRSDDGPMNQRALDPTVLAKTTAAPAHGGNVSLPAKAMPAFEALWDVVKQARQARQYMYVHMNHEQQQQQQRPKKTLQHEKEQEQKEEADTRPTPAQFAAWWKQLVAPDMGLHITSGLRGGQCADIDRCVGVTVTAAISTAAAAHASCVCYGV